MKFLALVSPSLIGLLCSSCLAGPDRPRPPQADRAAPEIGFLPFMGGDVAAPAMRISLRPAPAGEEVVLVHGKLSTRELQDLQAGRSSKSLQQRQVAFLAWNRGDSLEIAPSSWIEPGEVLTIGLPSRTWTHTFRVEDPEPPPRLRRLWPPLDRASAGTFAVWCLGLSARGDTQSAVSILDLDPGPVPGRLSTGALEGIGRDCISWEALEPPRGALAPPPLALLDDGRVARIDPTPIVPSWVQEDWLPGTCGEGRIAMGPACARVMDDRVEFSVESGAWWLAAGVGAMRWAGPLSHETPWICRGLSPGTNLSWQAVSVDLRGNRRRWVGTLRTLEPMPHVVLNEVLANPSGTEPEQEWVELYNDGSHAVDLEGWVLEDPGGAAVLPSGRLEPGRYALVVNEAYRTDAWPDPGPADGALILRVPKLGNQGLSNGGEPLQLRDPVGEIRSGILPVASPKPGHSVARRSPDAVDWLEGSFTSCSPSTPGAPNRL